MNECELCPNTADYRTVEGGWFVCKECVVTGKSDGLGA